LKEDHLRIISANFGWDWLSSRNFFKWPKLLYFKPESAHIWTV
jgi:hypothetical protein